MQVRHDDDVVSEARYKTVYITAKNPAYDRVRFYLNRNLDYTEACLYLKYSQEPRIQMINERKITYTKLNLQNSETEKKHDGKEYA